MKKIIVFIVSLLVLFFLFGLVTLLLPSNVRVTNSINISAPRNAVYKHIADLSAWTDWYPPMEDSAVSLNISPGGTSLILKDQKGKQLILQKIGSAGDTLKVRLTTPGTSPVLYNFIIKETEYNSTLLILNTDISLRWYPWERLKGIFMDKMVSPIYERALKQLKNSMEAKY